jgi:hypothetical protein
LPTTRLITTNTKAPLRADLFLQSVKYIMFDHANAIGRRSGRRSARAIMISGRYLITTTAPSIILAPAASVFGIYCPSQQKVSPASGACAIQMMCRIRNKGTANVEM